MTGAPSIDLRESLWRAAWRWGACLIAVLVAHGAIASLLALPGPEEAGAPPPSPIMIDLAEAATPMASIEDVSKLLPDAEPPEPLPPIKNPIVDMLPTPEPPPEVKIEITIEIPPPELPPPVDIKPPEKIVVKPPPKPPEKKVMPKRVEPSRAPPSPAPADAVASGAPSPAPPTVRAPNPGALASWRGALFAHLARHKRYPSAAKSRGYEGVVYVRFTMTRQGAVVATRVEKPSGHEVLDIEGSDLVRRAQPLPAPPADMPGEQIEVIVPINFNLH